VTSQTIAKAASKRNAATMIQANRFMPSFQAGENSPRNSDDHGGDEEPPGEGSQARKDARINDVVVLSRAMLAHVVIVSWFRTGVQRIAAPKPISKSAPTRDTRVTTIRERKTRRPG
jgi:hypothetical protein